MQDEGFLERAPRPGVLLTGESGIAGTDVQLHRGGVEREPFTEDREGFVIPPFVVQLMRSLVVLFRTQEVGTHGSFALHRRR